MAYSGITKPSSYFNTKLWTGTGSSNALTGVGFQPDWVWIKSRSDALSHALFDAVRGTTKVLNSNAATAEYTNTDTLTAFGTDGFTVGSNTGVNASGETRVAWNWKANGAGSSNSNGSIASTVSANTTAGFSIVSYTGTGSNATVGHGLGSAPKMVIVKCRSQSDGWFIYNQNIGAGNYMRLDQTIASSSASTLWNSTDSTSSVFSLGTNGGSNGSSRTYIAYCFAEKAGYSKIGSYTGNGNAEGPFVYTGFKPAWLLLKESSAAGEHWFIYDNKRSDFNVVDDALNPNDSSAEYTGSGNNNLDILSNGFKLRATDGRQNASGETYIYMAFAEEPLVANVGESIPATAR